MPSDLIAGDVLGLDRWTREQDERRAANAASLDRWLARLGSLILILTLLYVFVGPTPFDHQVTVDPDTGGSVMSPINRYVWLIMLALSGPILWFRRGRLIEAAKRIWPLFVLYAWFAATLAWALDPAAAERRFFLLVVDLIMCAAISLSMRDGRQLHRALAWACGIMVGIDLACWVILPTQSMTDIGLAAIHSHKNTLGSVMLLSGMVCGPYILAQQTRWGRVFWSLVVLAGFALLVASRSKTSLGIFIGVALFAPVLMWTLSRSVRGLWGLIAVAVTAVAGLLLAYLAWCYNQTLDPLAPVEGLTFTERKDVWRFVIGQAELHPWRGLGFGSFWDIDPHIQPSLQTDEWFARPDSPTNEAHDGYLDLWVTTGLVGLAGALAILARWTWRMLESLRQALIGGMADGPARLPYALFQSLFVVIFIGHNFLESSFFAANTTLGLLVLLNGVDVDLRRGVVQRGP